MPRVMVGRQRKKHRVKVKVKRYKTVKRILYDIVTIVGSLLTLCMCVFFVFQIDQHVWKLFVTEPRSCV